MALRLSVGQYFVLFLLALKLLRKEAINYKLTTQNFHKLKQQFENKTIKKYWTLFFKINIWLALSWNGILQKYNFVQTLTLHYTKCKANLSTLEISISLL